MATTHLLEQSINKADYGWWQFGIWLSILSGLGSGDFDWGGDNNVANWMTLIVISVIGLFMSKMNEWDYSHE